MTIFSDRPGDLFKKTPDAPYRIESGMSPWAEKQRGQLYAESKKPMGYQDTALGELARTATAAGPSIAGREADVASERGLQRVSGQIGTAGGTAQAARGGLLAAGKGGTQIAGPAMAAAASERLGKLGAYAGGAGQAIGGRTALEQIAQGYGQMGQLDKFRAQQMAHREQERAFQRQLNAYAMDQQQYQDTMNTVLGGMGSAASLAQMYGGYSNPPPKGGNYRYEASEGTGSGGAVETGASLGSEYF
jgi:hypothetical protein